MRKKMRSWVCAVAAVLLHVSPGVAQVSALGMGAGQLIRVTSPLLEERTVATLDSVRADTLFAVRASGGLLRIPLVHVTTLELAQKDRLKGGLIGGVVGALAATALLTVYADSQGGWMDCYQCGWENSLPFGIMFGVPVGGTIGGIIGWTVGARRWKRVQ